MFLGVPPQKSCARGWAAAAAALIDQNDEAYNVVIDIADPSGHDDADNQVIALVDQFLRRHDQYPIITVSNTIFPQSLYDAHGVPEFYDVYLRDFDQFSPESKRWGRYFERMTRHVTEDGETYNPLAYLIDKLKKNANRYSSSYELAIYDPLKDRRVLYGNQCLSFISFKVVSSRLCATAVYRNHTYITRCLGNLIGLGRLQAFVASQSGLGLGSLTSISTHGFLDPGNGTGSWGIRKARELVHSANQLLSDAGH